MSPSITHRPLRRLAFLVAIALGACDGAAEYGNDVLRAEVSGRTLTLSTRSNEAVYYFAVDRAVLPMIDWAPCTSPATGCRRVLKGHPVSIPYSQLVWNGEGGGVAAYIAYWRLNPAPSYGIRGSVETLIVPLHRPITPLAP